MRPEGPLLPWQRAMVFYMLFPNPHPRPTLPRGPWRPVVIGGSHFCFPQQPVCVCVSVLSVLFILYVSLALMAMAAAVLLTCSSPNPVSVCEASRYPATRGIGLSLPPHPEDGKKKRERTRTYVRFSPYSGRLLDHSDLSGRQKAQNRICQGLIRQQLSYRGMLSLALAHCAQKPKPSSPSNGSPPLDPDLFHVASPPPRSVNFPLPRGALFKEMFPDLPPFVAPEVGVCIHLLF